MIDKTLEQLLNDIPPPLCCQCKNTETKDQPKEPHHSLHLPINTSTDQAASALLPHGGNDSSVPPNVNPSVPTLSSSSSSDTLHIPATSESIVCPCCQRWMEYLDTLKRASQNIAKSCTTATESKNTVDHMLNHSIVGPQADCPLTDSSASASGTTCTWSSDHLASPMLTASQCMNQANSSSTTAPMTLCQDSNCLPKLNLSQHLRFNQNGEIGIDIDLDVDDVIDCDTSSLDSFHMTSNLVHVSSSVLEELSCPAEQLAFHHHHHHHSLPLATAHVHCNEEVALSNDERQREAHVHSQACNPQVHYQFATNNVLHDHTVPLLESMVKRESAAAQTIPASAASASASTSTSALVLPSTSFPLGSTPSSSVTPSNPIVKSNFLPCSRVHTFPANGPTFRFHPYGVDRDSPRSSAAGNNSSSSVQALTSSSLNVPASNCHQCKVKKYSATVIQCTAVHEVTVRRSKPMCCVQKKKCAKKYCATCLLKHYGLQLEKLDRATFVCPGCMGHCNCAACSNKARAGNGNGTPNGSTGNNGSGISEQTYMQHGGAVQDGAALSEMQTIHTHHQHAHIHALGRHLHHHGTGYQQIPQHLIAAIPSNMNQLPSHSHPNAIASVLPPSATSSSQSIHPHPHLHLIPSIASGLMSTSSPEASLNINTPNVQTHPSSSPYQINTNSEPV